MTPENPRRPAAGSGFAAAGFTLSLVAAAGLVYGVLPVYPCPQCRTLYAERLRYARDPRLTPAQAEAIRVFARRDSCGTCGSARRISILKSVAEAVFGTERCN